MKTVILGNVSLNPEAFIGVSKEKFMEMNLPCDKENAWNLIQIEIKGVDAFVKEKAEEVAEKVISNIGNNGSTDEISKEFSKNQRKRLDEKFVKKSRLQGEDNSDNSSTT